MFSASRTRPSGATAPGTPTTALSTRERSRPVASTSALVSSAMRSSTSPASARGSSTSWRARTLPARSQIAPRRKRVPRSSPRTSAASGIASKNTAP